MSKGYPDYFGQGIFLHYGGAIEADFAANVTADTVNPIFTISKKGILYNIQLNAFTFSTIIDDVIVLYIDGSEYYSFTFAAEREHIPIYPNLSRFFIECYDTVNHIYTMSFVGPINFESTILLTYEEKGSNAPLIDASCRYSDIK